MRRKYAWLGYVDGGGPRREFFSREYRKLYMQRYTYQKLSQKVSILIISMIHTHFDLSLICEC